MSDKTAPAKENAPANKVDEQSSSAEASLNLDEIRELANLVNEFGFTDFKFENEKIKVRLSKQVFAAASALPSVPMVAATSGAAPSGDDKPVKDEAAADEGLHIITSPIVGTFYRAPGPDKEEYVKEGSKVSPESVVCIVEAMKLMNEIQAETSGEVVRIFVENGQPVEYGQPLFGIRK